MERRNNNHTMPPKGPKSWNPCAQSSNGSSFRSLCRDGVHGGLCRDGSICEQPVNLPAGSGSGECCDRPFCYKGSLCRRPAYGPGPNARPVSGGFGHGGPSNGAPVSGVHSNSARGSGGQHYAARASGQLPGPSKPPPSSQPHRRLRLLTREVKTALGCRDARHKLCINCWQEKSEQHRRNWRECPDNCPKCPNDHQHRGRACPSLLADSNDEWWLAHCGIKKPGNYFPIGSPAQPPIPAFGSTGFAARSLHGQQAIKVEEDAKRSGHEHSRTHSLPRATGQTDRHRSRSRSPPREREERQQHLTYSDLRERYRDRRSPQPSMARGPQAVGSDSRLHEARLKGTGDANPSNNPSGTSSNTAKPQALLWSDGNVTAPSVREMVATDPWISMIIHQTVKFADFFQRHPEVARGEDLVSAGMSQYLSEIRSDQPGYLSTSGANGTGSESTSEDK